MPIPVMFGNWANVFLAHFPRRTGKGDYVVVSCSSTDRSDLIAGDACPGLFYQTPAQDGFLVRIRVPGGCLNAAQAEYLAAIARDYGGGQVWLTNRANVQLRLDQATMPDQVLQQLQELGLAARDTAVDHLRNIMASPTAGIDRSAMIDVQPLVRSVDDYLSSQPEFAPLSAKFSIGFDGGEAISIRHRRNDLWFVAGAVDRLHLFFGEVDTGIVVAPDRVVEVVAAICRIYLAVAPQILAGGVRRKSRKPRWQEVVAFVGFDEVCQRVGVQIGCRISPRTAARTAPRPPILAELEGFIAPIGVHAQINGQRYVGLVIPLGTLQSQQLQDLAELAKTYGNGELRTTPWQNIVIPHVRSPMELPTQLQSLGYSIDPNHPAAGLVACTGLPGCASAFTLTQSDALQISEALIGKLDRPMNIHVSGCAKGCAQPYGSDIALMGMESGNYDLYGRSGNQVFGQLLRQDIAPNGLPQAIQEVLPC
jgi:ferredoxin-nitrite reductase